MFKTNKDVVSSFTAYKKQQVKKTKRPSARNKKKNDSHIH